MITMKKVEKFISLPVLAVLLLMLFVYYTSIFIFLNDWLSLESSPGTLNAAIVTVLASFSLLSFFVCVLTDPGHVPSSYVPDVDVEARDSNPSHEFVKDNAEGKKCDKCFGYKPPRTHHCRVCKRCILKMDHHCVWINNCVGYWNYKAFFVFVLYATIASLYSMVIFISCVLQKDWGLSKGGSLKIFYALYGTMVTALTITLSTLFGWHVYLILHNMTTIEYYEGNRAKWLAMKSGLSYRHPFNIGAYKNITLVSPYSLLLCLAMIFCMYVLIVVLTLKYVVYLFLNQTLGPNMLKWLCPTAVSHLKDGVNFPTLRDNS